MPPPFSLPIRSGVLVLLVLAGAARAVAEDAPHPAAPSASIAPSAAPSGSPTPAPPLQWRSLGPSVSGGRVAAVAGSDLDPALMYAGAAGGGVWKSSDGGLHWSPVFDRASTQSIGAIAISPKNVDDVWVGTGEAWPRNDVIPGDGMYHSLDGGKTWSRAGLASTSQIARVLIDPRDPQRLIVAALGDPFADSPARGVFRSIDGGRSWEKVLYAGPGVGASDVAMDPRNPDVLLAGLWRFRRSAWNFSSGGDDDGLYRSTDGGAHWTRLRGAGLPATPSGRIGLAIAPSDPNRIYALIESSEGLLWRSDDGGVTWTKTSSNTLIDERPFYYTRIVVDPHDADHLFSVSVRLAESTNGGKTWHVSGKQLHGDHHDLWISADGRTILDGNDGGVGLSRDGGRSWRRSDVLPIAQFYHVSLSAGDPYRICGGLQDDGAWCAPSRTGDAMGLLRQDWLRIAGGDGTWVVPSPDGATIFASLGGGDNQGELVRRDANGMHLTDVSPYLRDQNVVPPRALRWRFNWETPLAFSPQQRNVLYAGGNVLFRTNDAGMHWTPISPDLTRNLKARQGLSGGPVTLDVTGAETFDTILAIAPSPLQTGLMWIGTDDGVVAVTRDDGRRWSNVTIAGLDADARVPSVEASPHRVGTAYAVVDRHYVGDRAPYVYVTDDYGATWRAIVHGLPAAEVHVVREDPVAANVLYAGTGKGVWWSWNRGVSWQPFPAPLPAVEVRDLQISGTGDLVAATHGRGVYVFDDLAPLREHAAALRDGVRLFALRNTFPLHRVTPTTNGASGADDPAPATIAFWQSTPAASPPTFTIVDERGRVVRHIGGTHEDDEGTLVPTVTNFAGNNRLVWKVDRDPPTPWRRVPRWNRGPDEGPPVHSGTYVVRMLRDGKTYAQTIRIGRDPGLTSAADEDRGAAFVLAAYDELSALDDALNGLDNVRLALKNRWAQFVEPGLQAHAQRVLEGAQQLEGAISSQPVNGQDDDFLRDLLRERVLSFLDDLGPGTPTQAQIDEAGALRRESDAALRTYRTFVTAQVQPLNDALRAAGIAVIDLRAVPAPVKADPNADEHARKDEE
jgi:photosystem II stability/assembly factor-like uncharacterized protein